MRFAAGEKGAALDSIYYLQGERSIELVILLERDRGLKGAVK